LLLLTSCTPVIYSYDTKTRKWSIEHFTKWGGDPDFLSQIDDNVKGEAENAPLLYGTWREYWIERCDSINYYEKPVLAEHYIQYIANTRREAGLPDIPEIDTGQFRPPWVDVTNDISEELDLEAKGRPLLSMLSVKLRRMTKTWPEYWEGTERNLLDNYPEFSTNVVKYIEERRKEMGLKPVE
jgi:hypothetical protein